MANGFRNCQNIVKILCVAITFHVSRNYKYRGRYLMNHRQTIVSGTLIVICSFSSTFELLKKPWRQTTTYSERCTSKLVMWSDVKRTKENVACYFIYWARMLVWHNAKSVTRKKKTWKNVSDRQPYSHLPVRNGQVQVFQYGRLAVLLVRAAHHHRGRRPVDDGVRRGRSFVDGRR